MSDPPEATLSAIRGCMSSVKAAGAFDKVHKEECAFSFDTPYSSGGLYVNLSNHLGFGEQCVALDVERSGAPACLYLHERWTKTVVPPTAEEEAAKAAAPAKLKIEEPPAVVVDKVYEIVVMPTGERLPFPDGGNDALPYSVNEAALSVLKHEGTGGRADAANAAWEEEEAQPSKYAAELAQEACPVESRISPDPNSWKCAMTGATENLWLNLSDGYIGGGRKYADGSGGSGGALDHFTEMKAQGKVYPLCVKLGTITAAGADVYSYAPDDGPYEDAQGHMVTDPQVTVVVVVVVVVLVLLLLVTLLVALTPSLHLPL